MHPHSRHVPPSRSLASTSATFNPYCEARIAQVYPAGPPPTTTTSKIVSATGCSYPDRIRNSLILRCVASFPETRLPLRCSSLRARRTLALHPFLLVQIPPTTRCRRPCQPTPHCQSAPS